MNEKEASFIVIEEECAPGALKMYKIKMIPVPMPRRNIYNVGHALIKKLLIRKTNLFTRSVVM